MELKSGVACDNFKMEHCQWFTVQVYLLFFFYQGTKYLWSSPRVQIGDKKMWTLLEHWTLTLEH